MQTTQKHLNGIDTVALGELVEEIKRDQRRGIARFGATTRWKGGMLSGTRISGWELGGDRLPKSFEFEIDEPPALLGEDRAPNPQEFLLAAMNACILNTFVAGCALAGIELESVTMESEGELDLRGFLGIDPDVPPGYTELYYTIRVKGSADEAAYRAVHEQVMATSPNFWNIARPIRLRPTIVAE